MEIGQVWKHKEKDKHILIDSFATTINKSESRDMIIVCQQIIQQGCQKGFAPSFALYGTQAEIEGEYELFKEREDAQGWFDI